MPEVTQVRSLSHAYTPTEIDKALLAKADGKLADTKISARAGGVQRGFVVKTGWERFQARVGHWNMHKGSLKKSDGGASTLATRFNKRHLEYSGKIAEVVSRLKTGETADIHKDVLATLRNDVKWMHKNAPWTSRTELLATRMDVELSKLSSTELDEVAKSLKDAHSTPGLSDKDIADVRTMQRAVVRELLVRSDDLNAVVETINPDAPSDVANADDLLDKLNTAGEFVKDKLEEFGIETPKKNTGPFGGEFNPVNEHINGDILSGAIRSAVLKPPHNAKLEGLNQNLLNVERALHKRDSITVKVYQWVSNESGWGELKAADLKTREVAFKHPELRALSRAVREEFLKSKVTTFKDENLRSRMSVLGSGAAHEVCEGSYRTAQQQKGVSMVHKYDDEELVHPDGGRFGAPDALDIDQSNPRLLERAVFTSELDKELDFQVSVGTEFALHHDKLGIVMEKAPGKTASGVNLAKDAPMGEAQKQLIKLQLLDIITGQADRHHGNYMVKKGQDGGVEHVKAIDSDFCMGPEPDDSNKIVGKRAVHLPWMPPVVDADMAKAINNLTPERLKQLCGGMFDDDSVRAAQGRLQALKNHIAKTGDGGCTIIDPKDWGSTEVTKKLTETTQEIDKGDKGKIYVPTSYWQRQHGNEKLNKLNK